jgi:hypothetical protein
VWLVFFIRICRLPERKTKVMLSPSAIAEPREIVRCLKLGEARILAFSLVGKLVKKKHHQRPPPRPLGSFP